MYTAARPQISCVGGREEVIRQIDELNGILTELRRLVLWRSAPALTPAEKFANSFPRNGNHGNGEPSFAPASMLSWT